MLRSQCHRDAVRALEHRPLSVSSQLDPPAPRMTHMAVSAGRAGVPMEVMGLMLGEFVDDYTVKVSCIVAVPRTATLCFLQA